MESLFRIAFWIIFGGMIGMQACFASRAWQTGARKAAKSKTIERDEEWGHTVVRVGRAISLVAFLVIYASNSPWLEVLRVPFPESLRWIGGVIGAASLAFYAWARAALGKEWSSPLQVREQHHLVTTGPYEWVRHPIYSALIGFMTGIALITANWFLVAFLAVSIVDLCLRIPMEEQMMIDEFGDEYIAYMQRTGRLLPR
jgi:protein-S-isoprenylcysteine O-methyltransferase Ste14